MYGGHGIQIEPRHSAARQAIARIRHLIAGICNANEPDPRKPHFVQIEGIAPSLRGIEWIDSVFGIAQNRRLSREPAPALGIPGELGKVNAILAHCDEG